MSADKNKETENKETQNEIANVTKFLFDDYAKMASQNGFRIEATGKTILQKITLTHILTSDSNSHNLEMQHTTQRDLYLIVSSTKLFNRSKRRDFENFRNLFPAQYVIEGKDNKMETYTLHIIPAQSTHTYKITGN